MIKVDERIQPVTVLDQDGRERRLPTGKPAVIFFFPKANTPG